MDDALRIQLLKAIVRDRQFLHKAAVFVQPSIFEEKEEQIVADIGLTFYRAYESPVGPLLRTHAEDAVDEQRLGSNSKKKLFELVQQVLRGETDPAPVDALVARVKKLKRKTFYTHAVNEIVEHYDQGTFTSGVLSDIIARATTELSDEVSTASEYFEELDKRQLRRANQELAKYPLLFIDPLDEKIKAIGRKHLGIFLAPYKAGKSLALVHVSTAYAMQALNVLYITLEDPKETVEDRLDASLTGISLGKLHKLPNKLKRKFNSMKARIRGRIRIVDGTDGGWTVSRIERQWEYEKLRGFTADAIILDYDDELVSEKVYKGESARRMEFADIYRGMRQLAARLDVIFWTAAQATRGADAKRVVSGKDAAEDISKIRKVFLAIGIGSDGEVPNVKHLYVAAHKLDRSRFGVDIATDFDAAIFYDRDGTVELRD